MPLHIQSLTADPDGYAALVAFKKYVVATGIPAKLRHLIDVRASQINGCAYCLDLHTREARHAGEAEHRLYALNAWRETPFFTPQERAVLALTEHVTRISEGVPEELDAELRKHFDEMHIAQLLMAVIHINAWNRLGIATGMQPAAH